MSTKFYSLSVKDVKRETADTVSIAFEVPANLKAEYAFVPGQYLTLKTSINGTEVRRSYSICSTPADADLRVAVKAIPNGTFSGFATTQLKAGDQLEVMVPMGNFTVSPSASATRNYIFFAAGSGITPVLSMVKSILDTEKNSKVILYYSNKTKQDIIFKESLDNLKTTHSNFSLHYLLTREDSGNALTNGRIDKTKCDALYQAHLGATQIDGVFSCGPQEMIFAVKEYFLSKGIEAGKIHFELFTATAAVQDTPKHAGAVDAVMTVIMDDEKYNFKLNTNGKTILQAAQDAGADVPFSCKGGVCCTCKAKVMEGSAKMDLNYALEPDEVEAGFILTCQAHPTSEKVVVSFDEY